MKAFRFILIVSLILSFYSCNKPAETGWYLDAGKFQDTIDGKPTDLYRLSNKAGMEVYVTNYGAVIPAILVPDRDGKIGDVTLGFDNVQAYTGRDPSFGAVVGRYGNRIDGGKFELGGTVYELPINETGNGNHLHGGTKGFSEQVFNVDQISDTSIALSLTSPDGDMGYPGTLELSVTYTLTEENALEVVYRAVSDAPTVLNVTQHSYFNLNGEGSGDILDHVLMLNADHYTPVNRRLIPTGEIAPVEGTPMDFTTPTPIGERIEDDFEQLQFGRGYDHNWVLNKAEAEKDKELKLAATVYSDKTGRFLEVLTTEPGVQFYCGNFLDGSHVGKSGVAYEHRGGLCLETQHFPDSPNHPNFPTTVLNPGEEYYQKTVFRFSTR